MGLYRAAKPMHVACQALRPCNAAFAPDKYANARAEVKASGAVAIRTLVRGWPRS